LRKVPDVLSKQHQDILRELVAYSEIGGGTGKAIGNLLIAIRLHFLKEEMLALPILSFVPDFAWNEKSPRLQEIANSERALRAEYQQLFVEHEQLKELISHVSEFAGKEKHAEVVKLMKRLNENAKLEEDILYPTALLAGLAARLMLRMEAQTIFE
jgi:hypothetical protein